MSGLGHVLRQHAFCEFMGYTSRVELLILLDHGDHSINKELIKFQNWKTFNNEESLLNYIGRNSTVLVDYYNCNVELFNTVANSKSWKVVVCSDIDWNIPDCSILINHLPNVNIQHYSHAKIKSYFFGPEYAILRRAFYLRPIHRSSNRFLICLGGSRVRIEIELILNALLKMGVCIDSIDIVTSENLSDLGVKNCYWNLNDVEMRELIATSFVCIVTPGNISYEVFKVHRRAIIGSLNSKQLEVSRMFQKLGLSVNAGKWRYADFSSLSHWIDKSKDTVRAQHRFFGECKLSEVKELFEQLNA